VIEDPLERAETLARFLGGDFDAERAAAAVDPGLHRHATGAPIRGAA
jgi:hypothetical protein